MCRIAAVKSKSYEHPSVMLRIMEPMQKGHDNSGFAIVMQDLGGVFEPYKDKPLLSCALTDRGVEIVEDFMRKKGFTLAFHWSPKKNKKPGLDIQAMDHYHFENYDYPKEYENKSQEEKEELLLDTRLELRALLDKENAGYVYSFWPDVLTLKEIGNPSHIGEYFDLWDGNKDFVAKIITAQARQNTNYDIVRYAAHPFFLQGYTVLVNGENTFYQRNKEYQMNLHRGYIGFESDSQCFLYTLHYCHRVLKWPLKYYKDIITPLPDEEIEKREDKEILKYIKASLAFLEINGPDTVIGVLPDGTMFSTNDAKKLRPVVVGGTKERVFIASEVCGLNAVCPERDWEKDIYTTEREMVVIDNNLEVHRWKQ